MKTFLLYSLMGVLAFSGTMMSAQGFSSDPTPEQMAKKAAETKFRWTKSFKQAQETSKATGLPIVLLFTGANWCGYCVKLEKEYLSKPAFKKGMDGVALGVKYECPSPGKYSREGQEMAKKYGVRGVPTMIVVDAEGKQIATIGYQSNSTPEKYVEFFKNVAK